MASLIMHFGMTKILMEKYNLDKEVLLGSILPDILKLSKLNTRKESHYIIENSELSDLEKYKNLYLQDEKEQVNLGYLLHLIQDNIWNNYLNEFKNQANENDKDFIEKIYSDMNICDKYVLKEINMNKEKFGKIKNEIKMLSNNSKVQQGIEDFFYIRKIKNSNINYISTDILKEYVHKALEACEKYMSDLL